MPIEKKLVVSGQFQDWYSGQMGNSYSSNCSLGGLYELVTYACGGLHF